MKLTVLMDNHTYIDQYYLAEPAVSYYIEDGDRKILFDLGYSDAYIKNAEAMNINLEAVDTLVFSHGHIDHTLGFKDFDEKFADNQKVIAHPLCFNEKIYEDEMVGSPLSLQYVKDNYDTLLTEEAVNITDNLIFLGEIPLLHDFESPITIGTIKIGDTWINDKVKEDTAMVYKTSEGIFVITGCSHAGICNIIEHAKKVCNDDRVLGVLGGFHLFELDHKTKETVKYLKNENIGMLYPAHCISLKVKAELVKNMECTEVGVGLKLEI